MIKSCIAVIFFLSIMVRCDAQQDYLVLIDADNSQPFYVRMGEKTFSSSPVGHLSIPHLKDSVYTIQIGFPQNQFPEQLFSIKVNKKDKGFRLRNLGDKGWALFNWQTEELKMPVADSTGNKTGLVMGVRKDDAFSRLMADVVNDSLVMYNTYVADTASADTVKSIVEAAPPPSKDSVVNTAPPLAVKTQANNPVAGAVAVSQAATPPKTAPSVSNASIVKLKSVRLKEGWRLTYVDMSQTGRADTIQLIIPYEAAAPPVSTAVNKDSVAKPAAARDTTKPDTTKMATPALVKTKPPAVNSSCREMASDYDVDVLRVAVLSEETQEKKLAAAKKSLKSKCLTVKQVRALSELFVSDSTRYEFFEAIYPSVQDRDNFPQLADLLIDHGYNSRFKANFTP